LGRAWDAQGPLKRLQRWAALALSAPQDEDEEDTPPEWQNGRLSSQNHFMVTVRTIKHTSLWKLAANQTLDDR